MGLAILNRVVRNDLTEKLTFEETAVGGGRGNCKCKGPEAGAGGLE